MVMKRKFLLGSAITSLVGTIALHTFVPASHHISFLDKAVSFERALIWICVILTSITFGAWFLGCSKSHFRGFGYILLCIAGLYIYGIHHAGRYWGIKRFGNPNDYYDPNAVSVFALLLFILCLGFVMYFGRRSSSTDLQGDRRKKRATAELK